MNNRKRLAIDFLKAYFDLHSNWADIEKLYLKDAILTHPLLGSCPLQDGYNALRGPFLSAFPDISQEIISTGETDTGKIFIETVSLGTFSGEWGGLAPNGKQWKVPVMWMITMNDHDKIIRVDELESHHMINDQLGLHLFKSQVEQKLDAKKGKI